MSSFSPRQRGILMLLAVTLIWGSTFAIMKVLNDAVAPAAVIAWRFSLAAILLLLAAAWQGRRRQRPLFTPALWCDGFLIGFWLVVSYGMQAVALVTTTANRTAFLTALSVLLVPLWMSLVQRRPLPWQLWAALPLALLGLGLFSWEGGAPVIGDFWAIVGAFAYAGFIITLERSATRHSALAFTAAQLSAVAIMGWIWAAFSGGPIIPAPELAAQSWGALLYLGVVATALTALLQTVGQRYVTAAEASLIYALEPVGAGIFSYLLLGERMGLRGLTGGALVVASTILSSQAEGGDAPPASNV